MDDRLYQGSTVVKSMDNVGITFVNAVLGRGVFNGVVNVQFGALPFGVKDDGTIDTEMVVACRLRMDVQCAVQLRDNLNELLKMIEQQAQAILNEEPLAAGKLN